MVEGTSGDACRASVNSHGTTYRCSERGLYVYVMETDFLCFSAEFLVQLMY